MAESATAFVLAKLDELLRNESSLIFGVRDEIRSLRNELQWIRPLLKDADKKSHLHNFTIWVGQLRPELYAAENIIDDFLLQAHNQRHHRLNFTIRRIFRSFTQYKSLRSYGTQIREIKKNLEEISANKSKYGVGDIQEGHEASSSSDPRREHVAIFSTEETYVVGFEEDISSIEKKLMESESCRRVVVSIVGMGGLGKTTLAKKVYNKVKGNFNCHAWITISQEYNVRALIIKMIHAVMSLSNDEMEKVEKMSHENLTLKLGEYLKENQYLIVVDDIWSKGGWDDLLPILPNGTDGSRVLLTTRNKDVALHADASSVPHELKFLPEKECWELFCKKAFQSYTEVSCPPELERLGKQIVAKCGGLPLAIVVLGGLLSRKEKDPNEWEKVYKSMNWQLQQGEEKISEILGLSYNDLPYYLKDCFLYCGVFPEDFEIQIQKLIRLLIAEGFIEPRGAETLEDIAEDYLRELIQRSMIQEAKKSCNGGVKTCRVHDLLRDLAISKAKESKFFEISVLDHESLFSVRRLVVYHDSLTNSLPFSHMRTVLNFAERGFPKSYFKNVLYNAKYLRVLDLEGLHLPYLPHQIGKLIHLRYLGLKRTYLKELPSSIGNLFNLHTLEIRESGRVTLPKNLSNLRALRHLCMGAFDKIGPGLKSQSSLAFLKHANLQNSRNLETIIGIAAGKWMSSSLAMLTNLRHLAIGEILSVHVDDVLANSLSKLHHLHSLRLEGEAIPMLKLGAHHSLYKMTLNARLDSLSTLRDLPSNLTKLCLARSNLKEDPFPVLMNLPKLKILRLFKDSYLGDTMHSREGGFLELKDLVITELHKLEHWVVDIGAFPGLRSLTFSECKRLRELPETLETMTSLQELKLLYMPRELIDSLQENHDSCNYEKIKKIPSVLIETSNVRYT